MQPQEELMLNLKKMCKDDLGIDLNLAELPKDGGVYAELGAGRERKYIRSSVCKCEWPVLFMCKYSNEQKCLRILSEVSNYFSKIRRLSDGNSYQFRGVNVTSGPHKTGRTEDKQVVYSCIVNFTISY